jgi:hypothetical protein
MWLVDNPLYGRLHAVMSTLLQLGYDASSVQIPKDAMKM